MRISKRSSVFCFIFCLLSGCATSSYKVAKQYIGRVEFSVTPDRVLIECEKIDTPPRGRYGFMIHVLDEENTVISIIGNIMGTDCFVWKAKMEKILNHGKSIYIAAFGDFDNPRIKYEYSYVFPKLGRFQGNGRAFQFSAIANENGECFDYVNNDKPPCPDREFPITDI